MLKFTMLTERADFLRLNRGRKFTTPYFIVRYAPGEKGCRVGYTVTAKCGNAVLRNRTKRRLRALTRELMPELGVEGMEYVFIALAGVTPNVAEAEYGALRAAFAQALAGIAKKSAA